MGPTVEPPETLPADFFDAPTPTPKASAGAPSIRRLIDETADRYGVPRALAHAVASMESDYNPMARSPKGAHGVMQLMPDTARELGVRNRLDPVENIRGGVQYLAQLSQKYKGNSELVLAAYNGGPGRVDRYGGIPPIAETRAYVQRGKKLLAQSQVQTQFLEQPTAQAMPETEPPATLPADFSFPETALVQAAAPVRHPMPEPPGAPKIAVEPVPVPPGFGQRVYEQTLQGPVELAKSLKADPLGTLKQTAANLFGVSQYQTILKQLQTGQYLPAAISILSFKNPAQMQAEAMTTPAIEDVRTGNLPGLAGDVVGGGLALFGAEALPKLPGIARATPTAAKGAFKSGLKAARSPRTAGEAAIAWTVGQAAGPKAGAATQALLTGTRITREAWKGARAELATRAARAAETLAAERTAAQAAAAQAARPGPVSVERQLPPGATRMPPAADASVVRSVPGEYATPEPLPPSRQLAAPGRPAIITPAPDPLAGDTSGVRAVPAVYGSSAVNEAAAGVREAMELQPGQFAPPAGRTAVPAVRASQIDAMARHMRDAGITAADAILLDPPELAALAKNAGVEGPLKTTLDKVRKRLAAMEKAEAETAKVQAALDRLSPAERQVTESYRGEGSRFARADEAPAVERKPPASETAAPTTAEQANVELGKSLSVEMPAEKPAPLTASEKRVKRLAELLAADKVSTADLAAGLKSEEARLYLEQRSKDLKLGSPKAGEIEQIVAEVERLRATPKSVPYQEQMFDVGMRIRNKQAVTEAEINALKPDDAAAMRRLQNEYRVRPTKPVEPPKAIRSGNSGFEQIEGEFDATTLNDDFLYHITTKPNAAKILKEGLWPSRPSAMAAGFYRDYSRGKAFLTDAGGVSYWKEKIANHIEHETGRAPKLVIVRIPKSAVGELATDTLGTRDAGSPSYFAKTAVRTKAK